MTEPMTTLEKRLAMIIVVACFLALVLWFSMGIRKGMQDIDRVMPEEQRVEFNRLRVKHGLLGFSVVEVRDSGMFFERGGERCRF
jgi:hypothetical protein